MPNRILKESICTSETIAELTPFEETFFYRLIVSCDDFGRFDARPAILKGRLFPLADVTIKAIQSALSKLSTVGILELYEVEGRGYLQLCTWSKHQQTRASKSKYPPPSEGTCKHLQADDINCDQLPANVPDIRIRKRETKTNTGKVSCTEPETASAPQEEKEPKILLPLNDGTDYPVSEEQCHEWAGLYPAVDVIQQLRGMRGWLLANRSKRKTRSGILRFINGWLAKEQNKGPGKSQPPQPGNHASYDIDELEELSRFDVPEELCQPPGSEEGSTYGKSNP